mmetsp:Transcript_524/g.1045  ORF Transcript_524/g.1045 Transcript_524/m.1045 type:complete len:385 (-) Transcript_524:289-1443(-)|eukprot:CAMPEP_0181306088 /NCGR_PEP_ID=MMETSP1101-20121128/10099_1 /TAXON_ID=46948 /ORGANISM="Rhodomonas abbreviata, Strain Caron Lab Isolate" /LENGTH=384 /DNA_ID=CAMNT_0023412093 /DNA_START=294 /DNA_END=1448 /DNA_ORIENTATION=-
MLSTFGARCRTSAVTGARAIARVKIVRGGSQNSRLFSNTASGWTKASAFRTVVGTVALSGGSLLLLSYKQPALAESQDPLPPVTEQAPTTLTEKVLTYFGLGSWVDWAVEPTAPAGLPEGKLLPDQPELPAGVVQRTLVLSLEDTLIHTEWDRKRGHRTKKRPGLDAFLAHMSQFYEIVIFTTTMSSYSMPIAQAFMDQGYVGQALYREHTKYVNGQHIKDLSYLNRDLRHVVIVDTNPVSYSYQPLNAIGIKPWHDDLDDAELLNLVPFLEAVVKEDIQDVREVMKHFQGSKVPDKFRQLKNQAIEKRKAGGSLFGRSRSPPGVLPVLSPLLPRTPAIPAIPAPALTPSSEPKRKEEGAASAEEKGKEDKKKNVFQLAKQHNH